jgi:hypothetical protein
LYIGQAAAGRPPGGGDGAGDGGEAGTRSGEAGRELPGAVAVWVAGDEVDDEHAVITPAASAMPIRAARRAPGIIRQL